MAFPTTGVLDAFTRADEGPLGNSTWSGPLFSGQAQLRLVSNACVVTTDGTANSSYWSANTFGPDCEIFVTFNQISTDAADDVNLFLRIVNPGQANLVDGYRVLLALVAGGFESYKYFRVDNDSATQLGATVDPGPDLVNGDKWGAEMIDDLLIIYTKVGAGAWTALDAGRSDATYTAAGNLAARLDQNVPIYDDFGGGTVVAGGMQMFLMNPARTDGMGRGGIFPGNRVQ